MFNMPVSFVGFPGEPRRYGPRGTSSYKVTTHGDPGWIHRTGIPHGFGIDPFMSPMTTSWSSHNGIPVRTPYKRPDWSASIVCVGFNQDEVTLKVSADKVFVSCYHKDGDEENFDTREKKKTIHIPDDVESGDIKAEMSKGGTLTLKAPYVQPAEETAEETAKEVSKDKKSEKKTEATEKKSSSSSNGTTQIKINRN